MDLNTNLIENARSIPIPNDMLNDLGLLFNGQKESLCDAAKQLDDTSGSSQTEPEAVYIDIRSKKMYFIERPPTNEPESINFDVRSPGYFFGRSRELFYLKNTMEQLENVKKHIIVVSGLGGIGKTQLVRQFIEINRKSYKNVIWINSESSELINESFRRLALDRLNMSMTNTDGTTKDSKSVIEYVFNKFSKTKTLFVYDNVNKIKSVKFVLTTEIIGNKPQVLITSRIQSWSGGNITVMQLKALELDDAIEHVSAILEEDTFDDKKALVQKLDALPLALTQATSYINHQRWDRTFTISDYIEEYDKLEILDSKCFQDTLGNSYEKTTFTTWNNTIDEIQRDISSGQLAIYLLNVIAFFEPENIHRDIFIHLPYEHVDVHDYEKNIRSAIRLLVNFSMVDSENNRSVLHVHRLVQLVVRQNLQQTGQEKPILRAVLTLILKLIDTQHVKFPVAHAISVLLSALKFNDLVEEFSKLPAKIISIAVKSGRYSQAEKFGHRMVQSLMHALGEHHRDVIRAKSAMVTSYIFQAQKFSRDFLLRRDITGRDNIAGKLLTRSNEANLYMRYGRHNIALQIYREILEDQKDIVGVGHPDRLKKMSDLQRNLKTLNEVIQLGPQIFKKPNNVREFDPHTFITRSKIADSYIHLALYTETLRMFKNVFEDKANNLRSFADVGSYINKLNSHLAKHDQLIEQHQRILETQILGKINFDSNINVKPIKLTDILRDSTHPALRSLFDTSPYWNKLKWLFFGNQNPALTKNLEKQMNVFEEDYLDTFIATSNIAIVYSPLASYNLETLRQNQVKVKNISSKDHTIIRYRLSLAMSYLRLAIGTCALQMYEYVMEKQAKLLGDDHQDTLITRSKIIDLISKVETNNREIEKRHQSLPTQNETA